MRIQFLETVPSGNPEFPFVGGQIVHLARLTPMFRQFIRDGKAYVLDGDEAEAAVLGTAEEATERRPRARGTR